MKTPTKTSYFLNGAVNGYLLKKGDETKYGIRIIVFTNLYPTVEEFKKLFFCDYLAEVISRIKKNGTVVKGYLAGVFADEELLNYRIHSRLSNLMVNYLDENNMCKKVRILADPLYTKSFAQDPVVIKKQIEDIQLNEVTFSGARMFETAEYGFSFLWGKNGRFYQESRIKAGEKIPMEGQAVARYSGNGNLQGIVASADVIEAGDDLIIRTYAICQEGLFYSKPIKTTFDARDLYLGFDNKDKTKAYQNYLSDKKRFACSRFPVKTFYPDGGVAFLTIPEVPQQLPEEGFYADEENWYKIEIKLLNPADTSRKAVIVETGPAEKPAEKPKYEIWTWDYYNETTEPDKNSFFSKDGYVTYLKDDDNRHYTADDFKTKVNAYVAMAEYNPQNREKLRKKYKIEDGRLGTPFFY